MSVVVGHHHWGSPGGGQLVCAATAYAFEALGRRPVLSGVFKFKPEKYNDWYGIDLAKYPVVTLPLEARAFGLWARLFVWLPAKKALKRYKADVLFLDEVTYRPLTKGRRYKIIEYIHFPFEVVVDPKFRGTGLAYGEDPYFSRYTTFPMSLYWRVFTWALPRFSRGNPFYAADLVLTNSKWTAEVAKLVYGERPHVLNPPIAPNVEVVAGPAPFEEREAAVVMLGRFSQEKRYDWVVREVAPRLIKEVPGAKIYIFGGAATPTLRAYLNKVRKIAEEAGVADVVITTPDAPRRDINKAMDKSRVFLHATVNEHWGIAVAEAMARGLPAVVHKSGGAWTDLAAEGEAALGYQSAEEAVESIAKLLTDRKTWSYYSQQSTRRAAGLTINNYIEHLNRYIDKFIKF
ncbi:MAG: glycosyltransferase [Pyrobaculum sp.]